MKIHSEKSDLESCIVDVGDDFSIYAIEQIKTELDKVSSSYQSVTFDLSNVEEFDSSGVQLLIAYRKKLSSVKKSFSIKTVSAPVKKLLTLYSLNNLTD